ncbi:hypothetical protein HanRHA438_Chr08g0339171 [Helianthus annuus]|nr:hypothetical protein HanIR_Chr08g0354201 [Helianthus annuus]KAJ0552699.1 hypothetical protein HanHA89_Chr08g0288081 [Helianthus annuus]KAJ0896849.1 hypothetical protein HanRHA438_Chr08g0339171 [Helianthus annuus]
MGSSHNGPDPVATWNPDKTLLLRLSASSFSDRVSALVVSVSDSSLLDTKPNRSDTYGEPLIRTDEPLSSVVESGRRSMLGPICRGPKAHIRFRRFSHKSFNFSLSFSAFVSEISLSTASHMRFLSDSTGCSSS